MTIRPAFWFLHWAPHNVWPIEYANICATGSVGPYHWTYRPRPIAQRIIVCTSKNRSAPTSKHHHTASYFTKLSKTSCCSTDSKGPHCCYHLPNKLDNVNLTPGRRCPAPQIAPSFWRSDSHLVLGCLGPPESILQTASRFSHFSTALGCDQQPR